eukprot:scaffold1954_cov268-Pinguiococcus_pyrenoidosus.AAC.6
MPRSRVWITWRLLGSLFGGEGGAERCGNSVAHAKMLRSAIRRHSDLVVLGTGVAGCAAALTAAHNGLKVRCVPAETQRTAASLCTETQCS